MEVMVNRSLGSERMEVKTAECACAYSHHLAKIFEEWGKTNKKSKYTRRVCFCLDNFLVYVP